MQIRARTGKMHRIAIKADEMMFFAGLGTATSILILNSYFGDISHVRLYTPPRPPTRRVGFSTWCQCVLGADGCLRSTSSGCEHGRPEPGGEFQQFYSYYRPASPADCATDDCNYCGPKC